MKREKHGFPPASLDRAFRPQAEGQVNADGKGPRMTRVDVIRQSEAGQSLAKPNRLAGRTAA